MRKAGYKANDYYLKQLIEEWCEGVIQKNTIRAEDSSIDDTWGPQNVLLERVASHLLQGTAERLVVDIHDLTNVEARILVLCVLRMIKEIHTSGHTVNDDLIILLGVRKPNSVSSVKEAITCLLRDELGLEIVSMKPNIQLGKGSSSSSDTKAEDNLAGTQKLSPTATRRPAVLQRLIVTRKSLRQWLRKKSGAGKR